MKNFIKHNEIYDSAMLSKQILESCANRSIEDDDKFSFFLSDYDVMGDYAGERDFWNEEQSSSDGTECQNEGLMLSHRPLVCCIKHSRATNI